VPRYTLREEETKEETNTRRGRRNAAALMAPRQRRRKRSSSSSFLSSINNTSDENRSKNKSSRVRVAAEVRVACFLGLPSCIFSNFDNNKKTSLIKFLLSSLSSSVSSSYGNEQDAHPKELTGLLLKNAFDDDDDDDDDHIRHKHTTTTTETKETAFKIFSKRLFLLLVLSSKAASAQY